METSAIQQELVVYLFGLDFEYLGFPNQPNFRCMLATHHGKQCTCVTFTSYYYLDQTFIHYETWLLLTGMISHTGDTGMEQSKQTTGIWNNRIRYLRNWMLHNAWNKRVSPVLSGNIDYLFLILLLHMFQLSHYSARQATTLVRNYSLLATGRCK